MKTLPEKGTKKLNLGLERHVALVKELGGEGELSFIIFDVPEDEKGVEVKVQDQEGSYLDAYYRAKNCGCKSKVQLIVYIEKFFEVRELEYLRKANLK